jgi:hypothetical protein
VVVIKDDYGSCTWADEMEEEEVVIESWSVWFCDLFFSWYGS